MPSLEVTNARLFAIAAPAMLANLTTPLLGVVGTAVIGRLGEAHLLGAVAVSALVFDWIFWLFGFLRMGTVALAAQAYGASDRREQGTVLVRALMVAAGIGLLLLVFQAPLARLLYGLMGGSQAVTEASQVYFFIRIWSAPFALANYVVLGWLIGLARAGTALSLQIAINLINLAVTSVLVLQWEFGVAGAAIGSVAAELSGFVAGMTIALLILRGGVRLDMAAVLDRAKLLRMLAINRDIMIRTAALIAAFAFFTAQGARSGDTLLAANAVLHNFMLIGSFFLDGFATAAEQLCGRSVGARDRRAFERAVTLILRWGVACAAVLSIAFFAAGDLLIGFMTASPEVREAARGFMLFAALAPLAGVMAYAYDGIFIGATWTRDMRNLMLTALALYFAAWWLLTPLGNAGLWSAILIFLVARGVLQAVRFRRLAQAAFPR